MPMRKLKEETDFFYSYMRQNGHKKTYQKDLILETFLNTEGHLSVEDIYALVKKKDKKVGVVTVFRTLKSLTACGIAREITLGDGLTRFEYNYHHSRHHHIVCTECHRAIELICPELDKIQEEIIQRYRFHPLQHWFQTYGICENCTELILIRDVIKMALAKKKRFLKLYKEAAGRNQDTSGKEVFEKMIRDEESHIEVLNVELKEIIKQVEDIKEAPVFLHFNIRELDALIPNLSRYEKAGELRLDDKTAADLVSSLNRAAANFFRTYADKCDETQGKQILINFADHESAAIDLMRKRVGEMMDISKGV
jgi:Fur family transcriptional regulator, ferric uptake regulator